MRGLRRIKSVPEEDRAVYLLWAFISLMLVSGGAAIIMQFIAQSTFGWKPTVHRERFEFDSVEYITISSSDIPLDVFTYDGDKIIVEYTGETAPHIRKDDFELSIHKEEVFAFSFFSGDVLNYGIQVFLPDRLYRDIKLSSAAGDITVHGIRATLLNINSRTGRVDVRVPDGFELRLSYITETGTLTSDFTNSELENAAWYTVRTVSGDLNFNKIG